MKNTLSVAIFVSIVTRKVVEALAMQFFTVGGAIVLISEELRQPE
jgi:hypothetical protein